MHEHIAALSLVVVGVDAGQVGRALQVGESFIPATAVRVGHGEVGLHIYYRAQRGLILVSPDVYTPVCHASVVAEVALRVGDILVLVAEHVQRVVDVRAVVQQRKARADVVIAALLVGVQRINEVRAFLNVLVVFGCIAREREHLVIVVSGLGHFPRLVVPRHRVVNRRAARQVCHRVVCERGVDERGVRVAARQPSAAVGKECVVYQYRAGV